MLALNVSSGSIVTNPLKNSIIPLKFIPNSPLLFIVKYIKYSRAKGVKIIVSINNPSNVLTPSLLRKSPYNANDNGSMIDISGRLPMA